MTAARAPEELVEQYGWAVIRVDAEAETPDYAYSLGLFKTFRHPEVIIFGLDMDVLHELVNVIGKQVAAGQRFEAPSLSPDVLEDYECAFRTVAPGAVHRYMGAAVRYYDGDFPAVHCLWPDRQGRFPWNPDASADYRRLQPMLSDGPEPFTTTRP